ncbi:MAG: hypothetical protein M3Z66_13925 [Chloroflexota bacterium]|nr:hypothetical protein [Chloroflexota bacterium]
MTRLNPHTAETAPEAARASLGLPIVTTPTRIYAYWPPLIQGTNAMQQALDTDRQVTDSLLRLAKLRTAQLAGCPF